MSKRPWQFHPDLSLDRLQLVAKILRDTRRDTLALHDPNSGDTPWSLGCRIYARSTERLIRAGDQLWPWLTVLQPTLEFVFRIGAVPLRFFHGDADHPEAQHLRVVDVEAEQLHFAFGDASADLIWRLVVESNAAGEADEVVLIGSAPEGTISCRYVIPVLEDSVSLFAPARSEGGTGVELPSPFVRPRRRQTRDEDGGTDV